MRILVSSFVDLFQWSESFNLLLMKAIRVFDDQMVLLIIHTSTLGKFLPIVHWFDSFSLWNILFFITCRFLLHYFCFFHGGYGSAFSLFSLVLKKAVLFIFIFFNFWREKLMEETTQAKLTSSMEVSEHTPRGSINLTVTRARQWKNKSSFKN